MKAAGWWAFWQKPETVIPEFGQGTSHEPGPHLRSIKAEFLGKPVSGNVL